MDAMDTCATVIVVCGFLAVMLYEVGMFITATVLCVIGVVCSIVAYYRCGTRKKRKKKRR